VLVLSILVRWVLIAVAVVLAAWATPDVELESDVTSVVVVSVLIALANVLAQLALRLLPLPRSLILLAVVTFVVNGLAVLLVSAVTSRFQVDGLLAAVTFAVLLSVFSIALSTLVPQSLQGGDEK
jgi:putative membrane protein